MRRLPAILVVLCLAGARAYPLTLPDARLLDSQQSVPDAEGRFHRIGLLMTDFKYPLIPREEELLLDLATGEEQTLSEVPIRMTPTKMARATCVTTARAWPMPTSGILMTMA